MAERQGGADNRQGYDSGLGPASGAGAADSKALGAGGGAAGTGTAAQGLVAGPGSGPVARARTGGSEASVAATPSARRGRRLAWECCMRLRDKRLAAEVALECLGAGAAVKGVVECHAR